MSNSKKVLPKFQIITSASMGASVTSTVTNIENIDNIAIQIGFTTSDAVGTFSVQGSVDHAQDQNGNVQVAGNWVALTLSPVPVAASAADNILISLNQLPFPWLRTVYTRTSGTGTLNAYIAGKSI